MKLIASSNYKEDWEPICTNPNDEKIVMCPVGGELRVFDDGTIVCIEGAKQWGFQLPPGVRLFHDTTMPLSNVDQWVKDREAARNEINAN